MQVVCLEEAFYSLFDKVVAHIEDKTHKHKKLDATCKESD